MAHIEENTRSMAGPTFLFDFKFPLPPGTATSQDEQSQAGGFSFQLSIRMPPGMSGDPVMQGSLISVAGATPHVEHTQQLEVNLREKLKQRKGANGSASPSSSNRPELMKLLTPPLTAPSESESRSRTSLVAAEGSGNGSLVRPGSKAFAQGEEGSNSSQTPKLAFKNASYDSRAISRGRSRSISEYSIRQEHRDNHPERDRSPSPSYYRHKSLEEQDNRGRLASPKRLGQSQSRSPSRSSRRSSRSGDRYGTRMIFAENRSQSRESWHRSDGMEIERLSDTSHRTEASFGNNNAKTAPNSRNEDTTATQSPIIPLRRRISDANDQQSGPRRGKRRICPFFHPTDHRHSLDDPHPGYSAKEFDEAVRLYKEGADLPPSLVKPGVTINFKNRPDVQGSSQNRQMYSKGGHGPSPISPGTGRQARERSPPTSPTSLKRRRITVSDSYYPSRDYDEARVRGGGFHMTRESGHYASQREVAHSPSYSRQGNLLPFQSHSRPSGLPSLRSPEHTRNIPSGPSSANYQRY